MKRRGIKRICKRIKEEIRATREIGKVLSWKDAIRTLIAKIDIQIMVHNGGKEYNFIKKNLMKKHKIMNSYFDKIFKKFTVDCEIQNEINNKGFDKNIWICWWQGEEKMPNIVKKCVESIRKNSKNVVIISDKNYKDYVEFPEWLEKKYKDGIITRTHLSDILRLELLSKYGGIWLDSTFYCIGNLEKYFEYPAWTIKRPNYRHTSVACGLYANYSLGCRYEYRYIYEIIKQYVYIYWKTHDYMIDYLFLDYIIMYVIKNYIKVKKVFDEIIPNNPMCDELYKVLNNEYNEEDFKKLIENTDLFKLSWKKNCINMKKGKITYYGKLINEE